MFRLRPVASGATPFIAWLSTCLIVSGASMMVTETTRQIWMWWGCFGLASAVGLEGLARYRLQQHSRRIAEAIESRIGKELGPGSRVHPA